MDKIKTLKVSIIMGSKSDYKIMKLCEKTLKNLGVLFETKIISAHRTPKRMYEYALSAEKNKTWFKTPWTVRGNYSQKMIIFKIQDRSSKVKFSKPKFIVDFEN